METIYVNAEGKKSKFKYLVWNLLTMNRLKVWKASTYFENTNAK